MKERQYHHRQACTSGGQLVIGEEYLLRSGHFSARVKLIRDRSTDDALKFRLEVLETEDGSLAPGSRITITADWEGSGQWQLLELNAAGK